MRNKVGPSCFLACVALIGDWFRNQSSFSLSCVPSLTDASISRTIHKQRHEWVLTLVAPSRTIFSFLSSLFNDTRSRYNCIGITAPSIRTSYSRKIVNYASPYEPWLHFMILILGIMLHAEAWGIFILTI